MCSSGRHYTKEVEALERVLRSFTRMMHGLGGLNYGERLDRLGLFSLEIVESLNINILNYERHRQETQ